MSLTHKQRIANYNKFCDDDLIEKATELEIDASFMPREDIIELLVAVESGEINVEELKERRKPKVQPVGFHGRRPITPPREEAPRLSGKKMLSELYEQRYERLKKYEFIYKRIKQMQSMLDEIYEFIFYNGNNC